MNCRRWRSNDKSLDRCSNCCRFSSAHLHLSTTTHSKRRGYRIAGPKSFASIACKISYISRNSICSDGGISNPDSYKSIHSPVITTWGGGGTRIKVSANSNCPCRIKCIAIVVLTSTSFPSNTSALITVEGSLLNFCSPPPHQSPVSDKD